MQLIECVPNFSEGRDQEIIDAITAEITAVRGARLLDVDAGADTNRTVVTFVGDRQAVAEAAFRSIAKASELIDMSQHSGAHPRMGATDVCPFVPVEDVTLEECAELAREVAERVASELAIPIYLYEHAARSGRRSLADVRRGEYEGLKERTDRPDLGPDINPTAGATAIGAREFLIAYNVNLNTTDRRLAHGIAQAVRELGTPERDDIGKIVKDENGNTVFVPGRFNECKAVGWYLEDYGRAQVSINLTNYNVTSVHAVFEACREEAARLGLRVTGSEIVGLIPRAALLAAGDYYLTKQGRTTGITEAERIRTAIFSLGLDEFTPFDPADKVVEYRVASGPGALVGLPIVDFIAELSSESPAPGGGSVAALCGALAGSLTAMVAALTHSKKGWEEHKEAMDSLGRKAQALQDWFITAVDRDTQAFNNVLTAIRLPRKSDTEITARQTAMAAANLEAAQVPLEVLEHSVTALHLAAEAAADGNPNSVSDAGVAGACAEAAARGASLNVRINLPALDQDASKTVVARHDAALRKVAELREALAQTVETVLLEMA